MNARCVCLVLLLGAIALEASAWGPDGHRIAARIAEAHLTDEAKAAVRELLGETSLADASVWADDLRDNPAYDYVKPLHYINVPRKASRINMREHCSSGQCVLGAIEKYTRELKDASLPRERRAEALKFLIHFIQDAHQPLHVAFADDRGGNSIPVTLFGESDWNLHRVWDHGLIRRRERIANKGWSELAEELRLGMTDRELRDWRKADDPIAWANESLEITRTLYDDLPRDGMLDDAYYERHIKTVEQRLKAAGIRVAVALNQTLGRAKGAAGRPKSQAATTPAEIN